MLMISSYCIRHCPQVRWLRSVMNAVRDTPILLSLVCWFLVALVFVVLVVAVLQSQFNIMNHWQFLTCSFFPSVVIFVLVWYLFLTHYFTVTQKDCLDSNGLVLCFSCHSLSEWVHGFSRSLFQPAYNIEKPCHALLDLSVFGEMD